MNAEAVPARQLICLLHDTAAGLSADAAAVELLASHGHFLHRRDFRRLIAANTTMFTAEPAAVIRWQAAIHALESGRLPCSTSQEAMLRIAASLGDDNIVIRLRQVLGGLDNRNIALVTNAITAANG